MPDWTVTSHTTAATTSPPIVSVAHKPTFAISEFLGNGDSVPWKAHLKRLGFSDVTPLHDHKPGVKSFNRLGSAKWATYQAAFVHDAAALGADWQYFSGHHGSQVAMPHGVASRPWFNDHPNTGFFNEPYHQGTWEGHAARPNEVMMSSSARPSSAPLAPSENPFLAPSPATRGVITIACNTFSYGHTRKWLRTTFPKAVMFGMMSTTPGGQKAIAPFIGATVNGKNIRGAFTRNGAFWRDPLAHFAPGGTIDDALVRATIKQINLAYYAATKGGLRKGDIGIMIDDLLYWWEYSGSNIRGGSVRKEKYDTKVW